MNEKNIIYLYGDESQKDNVDYTIELGDINIDVSRMGKIVGVEFLDARKYLKLDECQASSSDGECIHPFCPQNLDGEPEKTGRDCPLPWHSIYEGEE